MDVTGRASSRIGCVLAASQLGFQARAVWFVFPLAYRIQRGALANGHDSPWGNTWQSGKQEQSGVPFYFPPFPYGAKRTRTADPLNAIEVLYQLSYSP